MKNKKTYFIIFATLIFLAITIKLYSAYFGDKNNISFLNVDSKYADSLLRTLTLEEKISQLIVLKCDANDTLLFQKYGQHKNIGGLILLNSDIQQETNIFSEIKKNSEIPPFLGSFPNNSVRNNFLPLPISVAAIATDTLTERYISLLVKAGQISGSNFNFSPVLGSLNNENYSYFCNWGEKNYENSIKQQLTDSLQNGGILPCVSGIPNFPEMDSLAVESFTMLKNEMETNRIPALVLPDFLFANNLDSLSEQLHNLLNNNVFNGIAFADLNDLLFTNYNFNKIVSADAFLVFEEVAESFQKKILQLIDENVISEEDIDKKLFKLLLAKSWIQNEKTVNSMNISNFVNLPENQLLIHSIFEKSICLPINKKNVLPFSSISSQSIVCINIGTVPHDFNSYLQFYKPIPTIQIPIINDTIGELSVAKLNKYNTVIITLSENDIDSTKNTAFFESIKKLAAKSNLVICSFGNPEISNYFPNIKTFVAAFESHRIAQQKAAQLLFGGISPAGILPFSCAGNLKAGSGQTSFPFQRMGYTVPESVGLSSVVLQSIDSIVNKAIELQAMPGCQVCISKNGKVIWNKAYGFTTYDSKQETRITDFYDLASITKVAATTLTYMHLWENDTIYDLKDSLFRFLPDSFPSTLKNIRLEQFFMHTSGLQPNMPILEYIQRRPYHGKVNKYVNNEQDTVFSVPLAENLFFNKNYLDTIWKRINNLEVDTNFAYVYSDVNLNVLQWVIENTTGKKLNNLADSLFYKPLGVETTYTPINYVEKERIVPTQDDRYWRRQLLQGYVHDESAAIYGGVAGNAGLFSSAINLAVIFQMLLNEGYYAGKQYFKPETVSFFTNAYEDNTRGIGFNRHVYGSFGHTGFTGCCVWANTQEDIVFVFLSNRVHPSPKNTLLMDMNVRDDIYNLIFEAIQKNFSTK